mgnify:CR=1 FL=1
MKTLEEICFQELQERVKKMKNKKPIATVLSVLFGITLIFPYGGLWWLYYPFVYIAPLLAMCGIPFVLLFIGTSFVLIPYLILSDRYLFASILCFAIGIMTLPVGLILLGGGAIAWDLYKESDREGGDSKLH